MAILDEISNTKLGVGSPETPVDEIAALMKAQEVGSVLVLDEERRPLGIVTDRDLALRVLGEGRDANATQAKDVMSEVSEKVSKDEEISGVVARMKRGGVRRVPIVDAEGRAVAVVSFGDLFRLLTKELSDLATATASETYRESSLAAA